jgi:hypothetical protein
VLEALLDGLKLTGFSVWRLPDGGRPVNFPAALQPVSADAQNAIRDYILRASDHDAL